MTPETANRYVVLTNCTGRKLQHGVSIDDEALAASSSLNELASIWCSQLNRAGVSYRADALYAGRSFQDARKAASLLDARLLIASAGLGLIAASDCVTAYDLTVSPSGASILPTLRRLNANTADWWSIVNAMRGQPTPVLSAMTEGDQGIWFIAMPSTYLAMITNELEQLPADAQRRLRIFTSPAWLRSAPKSLAAQVLPYDDRLEGTHYAGTRNDFPQRAMLHFIENVHKASLTIEEATAAVLATMSNCSPPSQPKRMRRSDAEITSLLRENWAQHGGASGKLLRFLRDDALVQCEQSRFRDLWNALKPEMEGTCP